MPTNTYPDLTISNVSISAARSYHLRFEPFGWAIFTVNDTTSELSVQADWGISLAHRWPGGGLGGKTISEALAAWGDASYVCDKLHYGQKRTEFDPERTVASIKRVIISSRREGRLDREEARDLWFDLYHYSSDCDTADGFLHSVTPALDTFLEVPYEYIEEGPTFQWCIYLNTLLPAFFEALRDDLKHRAA